ncbi:hypothetical protein ACED56_12315 [Vibrio splendidus]|uniref:hypothetical protein n=1 Tax=Vibrio splendidus TaxID=29497 RepID=UPI00352C7AB9
MWSIEQFKSNLSDLARQFHELFLGEISGVIGNPNGDIKESMKAIISMDVVSIHLNSLKLVEALEEELQVQALLCLRAHQVSQEQANLFIVQMFYPNSLKSLLISDINQTIQLLNELKYEASQHLQVLENNSGVKGLFRGLFKGYSNPVDGLSHALGQGSIQIEISTSFSKFNTIALKTGHSIDALSQQLQITVLDKWNRDLGSVLANI